MHAPRAGPLYMDPPGPAPGGGEVQMHYLATTLAGLGLRVCHIVSASPDLPRTKDGVRLIEHPGSDESRGRAAQVATSFSVLSEADASVYVQRNAGVGTGIVGLYARARGRGFLASTSSDGDLLGAKPVGSRLTKAAHRVGIKLASAVVVQTDDQLRVARSSGLSRPLRRIRSFAEPASPSGAVRTSFLWIGRAVDYKNPLAYTELAERVPEARFEMLLMVHDDAPPGLVAELRERAERLDNLALVDPMPREQLLERYERAVAVVNTAHDEGFPNAFMEGWAHGAPAISLHLDPDRRLRELDLGRFAHGSIERLADSARDLWATRREDRYARRVRSYVAIEHAPERIGAEWRELIAEVSPRPIGAGS